MPTPESLDQVGLASGENSTAIGKASVAAGDRSMALAGLSSLATGDDSIAIGGFAPIATGKGAVAIGGVDPIARGDHSLALGSRAIIKKDHDNSVALGFKAETTRADQIMLGHASRGLKPTATDITIPDLANEGQTGLVLANGDGTLSRSEVSSSFLASADCDADGTDAACFGDQAEASGDQTTAIGASARATESHSTALGYHAQAQGDGAIAIGSSSQANQQDSVALGRSAIATGTNSLALGRGSSASHSGSTALGAGASTSRSNQLVLGTDETQVTVPNLAGSQENLVATSTDGTLIRANVSVNKLNKTVNTKVPRLEKAASRLGDAVESSGAIAAALSAVPEVSMQEDEPARCGIGTGGYGSQYALSAGCAVRVGDRLHLNGAIAYTPSIDYEYGSTPSIAGRLGFSFPLGVSSKKETPTTTSDTGHSESDSESEQLGDSHYLSSIKTNINQLQSDVASRDQQIDALKRKLEQLLDHQSDDLANDVASTEANNQLIALLKQRIDELEEEKKQSHAEDARQNQVIEDLQEKLAEQESMFKRVMKQLKTLIPGNKLSENFTEKPGKSMP